jgi:galactose mutarotase-like enzyme
MSGHDLITIGNARLVAGISAKGAELHSLVPTWGQEMLWQADPAVWGWHAPNLFPIVGALSDNRLLHRGHAYGLASHGFLRHSQTEVERQSADEAVFRLTDSPETRRQYPFAFHLSIGFRIIDDRLQQWFSVANPGDEDLLVSLGAHPAFRWPLAGGLRREDHRIIFSRPQPQGILRPHADGLDMQRLATPVDDSTLVPDDRLFEPGALVWDRIEGGHAAFGVPGAAGVEMEFADFPHFGVWTKPGAGFLCLEPWQGHMSPKGFAGELADKPGIVAIAPGAVRRWTLSIRPVQVLSA